MTRLERMAREWRERRRINDTLRGLTMRGERALGVKQYGAGTCICLERANSRVRRMSPGTAMAYLKALERQALAK